MLVCSAEAVIAIPKGTASNANAPTAAPARTVSLDLARFFRQHDRNAVADRVREFGGSRDQLLTGRIEFQRSLGQRTDQNLQQFWIDGGFNAFGRGVHA